MGCHLSSSKGFLVMAETAEKIGANTFQFFTRNPRGGKAKALDDEMGQEAVYTDASRMSAIVREKEDLVTRIEQMNESWFEVSTRLEELRDGQGA